MTTNRAVTGLALLVTGYFMITLGWDFPYARLFAVISGYLLYAVYTAEKDIRILKEAVNFNAGIAIEQAQKMQEFADRLNKLVEEHNGAE